MLIITYNSNNLFQILIFLMNNNKKLSRELIAPNQMIKFGWDKLSIDILV